MQRNDLARTHKRLVTLDPDFSTLCLQPLHLTMCTTCTIDLFCNEFVHVVQKLFLLKYFFDLNI